MPDPTRVSSGSTSHEEHCFSDAMPDVLHHAPGSITFQGMTWLLSPVPGRSLRYSVKEEEMHKTYRSPKKTPWLVALLRLDSVAMVCDPFCHKNGPGKRGLEVTTAP